MNIQDEIRSLNARTAAAEAKAAAAKQRAAELNAYASALEDEVRRLLSDPHFPEAEKKRILADLNLPGND